MKEGFVADVASETLLRDIVERYPAAKVVLSRYGFEAYEEADPPRESVARFAEARGIPVERLLKELNRVVDISLQTSTTTRGRRTSSTPYSTRLQARRSASSFSTSASPIDSRPGCR